MTSWLKISLRLLTVLALSAMVTACSQPIASGNFPSTYAGSGLASPAAASSGLALSGGMSIMDY